MLLSSIGHPAEAKRHAQSHIAARPSYARWLPANDVFAPRRATGVTWPRGRTDTTSAGAGSHQLETCGERRTEVENTPAPGGILGYVSPAGFISAGMFRSEDNRCHSMDVVLAGSVKAANQPGSR